VDHAGMVVVAIGMDQATPRPPVFTLLLLRRLRFLDVVRLLLDTDFARLDGMCSTTLLMRNISALHFRYSDDGGRLSYAATM
jgi:hypothetical protein